MPTRRTWATLLVANAAAASALALLATWSTHDQGASGKVASASSSAPPLGDHGGGAKETDRTPGTNVMKNSDPQTVTVQSPGRFRLELSSAKDGARQVLRVAVSGYRPASPPSNEFNVELRGASSSRTTRVGAFAMFPTTAFEPGGSQPHRGFVFDLSKPLSTLGITSGPVEIVVSAAPARASASPTSGDSLTIANVSIEARSFSP